MPFPVWLLDPHLFTQVAPSPPDPSSKSTKSASSAAPSKIAFLPPLNDKQGVQLGALIKHCSADDYSLPISEGKLERAPLGIREMMWLVRPDPALLTRLSRDNLLK